MRRAIQDIVQEKKDVLIGIIGLQPEEVHVYRDLASEKCKVMTAVEAQGLEFDVVVFVHHTNAAYAMYDDDLREEKRRVARDQLYVALTRAKKRLFLSYASVRTIFGSRQVNAPSEFLADIDENLVEKEIDSGKGIGKVIYF